jgi:gliding motility-associated-like protein
MKNNLIISRNLAVFLLLLAFKTQGQLQNNNWIFGYGARVNFSGANPIVSSANISSNEATASVSDPNTGQLLFYTDARNVWNANNQVMPNGNNLLGGYFTSCTQGALIVPFPNDNQRYYIFTLDELEVEPGNPVVDDGLRYSVVDMTLNGGLGDVQTSNMNTQLATDLTEKLIVIRSIDIQGFWVVAHKRNTNQFLAWKIDACGISPQPVVSTVGSNFISIPSIGANEGWAGAMDASPDGNRIGMPVDYSTRLEFFDFNKTTGIVSNPLTVNVTDDATAPFLRKYGACFSPDGSKFYYTNTNSVYQLDLSTYTSAAIASSHTLIYSTMFQPIAYPCFQIEQASNNKLYVAVGNSPRLDEISNPNASGLGCGYVVNAVNLTPGVGQLGLPDQVPLGGFAACNSGNNCNNNGNLIVYSNYDGGILTINVDQNIPNLKIGICTYEPIQVTFTGPFVGNITEVIYAGMNSNQNNNNCGQGNFTTSITGVPSSIVSISPPMNPPSVGYTPAHGNGAGPWGGLMIGAAGLCDTTVNAGGGNTPDEIIYYFLNATAATLRFHFTQYSCWLNETENISSGGNCCILPPNSNPCTPPSVPEITTAAATCAAAGTATISNYSGSLTYTFSPAGPSVGASGLISGMTPGTSYTVTASNGSCSSSASLSFNVAPQLATPNAPTADVTTQPTCTVPTAIVTVTAPSPAVGTTYTITGTAPVVGPQTNTSGVFSGLTPGTYDVTTTVGGCTSTATVLIVSPPSGAPTISVVSSNDVSCYGGNDGDATVSGAGGIGTLTYTWTPGNLSGTTQTGLSAGSFTVQVTDQSGCSNSTTVTIGQPTAITITETIIPANCGLADGSISIVSTGGTGNLSYSWTPVGGTTSSVTGLTPGNYSVLVIDQSGCTATENYNLGQTGSLAIDATPEFTTITAGESVQFNTNGALTYSWSPSSSLDCSDCPDPIATPGTSTQYIVTGTDANGCSGTDTVYVTIVPVPVQCAEIYVPTVFSPNGAGSSANKTICVYGGCVSELSFAIYNRWGEKVFETSDVTLTECWDGTYEGRELNSGTFVYKLIVTLTNNEVIEESGNITLIR